MPGVLAPILQAAGVTVGGAEVADLEHELRGRVAGAMSTSLTLLGGAVLGMAAGSLLVPFTRRELAASVARASAGAETQPS